MNAKTIQKYKKQTIPNLHKTAVKYFNRFIRLRDTDENGIGYCISNGSILKYGTEYCHAGHYFSSNKFPLLSFNEDNVHVQSKADNYFGHSEGPSYTINLIKKIGLKRLEALQTVSRINKRGNFKQDRFTLIDAIETYKTKCKELSKTKNFEVK